MAGIDRREFLRQAAYCGAALVLSSSVGRASSVAWQERRGLGQLQHAVQGGIDPIGRHAQQELGSLTKWVGRHGR